MLEATGHSQNIKIHFLKKGVFLHDKRCLLRYGEVNAYYEMDYCYLRMDLASNRYSLEY
jgi:hypothetical protein